MSVFTETPSLKINPDGCTWTLTTELTYYVGFEGNSEKIVVPEGYVTDLASVPRWLWSIFPPFGKYLNAAIVHDYIYSTGGWIGRAHDGTVPYTKAQADVIFREASGVLGVGAISRWLMYQAVKFGGKGAF